MNKLITALILVAMAATAQAQSLRKSIEGQDFIAMLDKCKDQSRLPAVNISNQDRLVVEEGVRKELKDPESAKFDKISAVSQYDLCTRLTSYKDVLPVNGNLVVVDITPKKKPVLKGLVNSKNSYGGYTGFKRFTIYEDITTKAISIEFETHSLI